jgi:hypothetical protein
MNTIKSSQPSIPVRIARILGIVFAIFISIFALEAFSEDQSLGETLTAFFMQLIPTLIILVILWIAWKWPLPGGILFILVGISYIISANQGYLSTYLMIAGPPILTGLLFVVGYILKKQRTA